MRELKAFLESRRDEAAGLLAELIRFKSVAGEGEDEIQRFLAEKFRALGLEVSLELVPESIKEHPSYTRADRELDYSRRPNLFAAWKGSGPKSVILCAHSDVVPAGDWTEAFNPVIQNGRVIGRGAADDKGHIVSIYYALLALKELGRQPRKSVEVQVVIEEETGGNGALAAILTGHRADGVIVMESTDLSICPANRGAVWYKIEMQGVPVHMGRIREGVNAVEKMAEVIPVLRQYENKLIAESNHPLFREYEQPVQVNIGMIKGGDWPAMVAGWAEMEGGVGFLPTKSLEDVQKELTALLQNHPDPWVREKSKVSFPKLHNDAYETRLDDPLVTGLKESAVAAGASGKVTGLIVSCDARLYAKVGQMPTVVFGPDSIKQAHSREESLSIDEMVKASEIIARYLLA
ncbi:MAG TPA: ArgE/DapE family deacylase [bacterium]|uniref:N-formyl-4-amino-5-aminomethyl-2-methylpyrimidine deformylase n=1 Tax=candidate division TA06 bacterium ADurb.Bin417 TaxID=1852828 RepID=A0A1V5MGS3_UNCT6|nr:MAG: N-formyl-4-amino-5-aminomethyl-2-methylpyrimidine deformylase [candidate division TA06 bacterium ADurb.Bin417]HNQ34853.1 ArgE/DapE family deacylase [bacterium]HNS48725.1 ArgE/DapE family deacylase [bacterium]